MGRRLKPPAHCWGAKHGAKKLQRLTRYSIERATRFGLIFTIGVLFECSGQAKAQSTEALPAGGASPGSADSIPTDKPKLRAFCASRPAQSTLPCTVDKGHFQLESDLINVTHDGSGGAIVDTYLYSNPTLKFGVANRADVEFTLAPYEVVRTKDEVRGQVSSTSGIGDLMVAFKQNLRGDYRGPFAIAIEPFVKAPTAGGGIGNGALEGGFLVPVAFGFKSFVLNVTPELDVRRNAIGTGFHLEPIEVINFNFPLPANLGLSTELYAREIQDPTGSMTKVSADLALAWGLPNDLQFDVGVNLGLNAKTAASQSYMGISKRF